ncbi:MAG TPA: DNA repair and recombination protein RadB [Candidatus Nanoarchaeia archaeon]|nr:DNA repair and recombination protein RadB [Candidatus Nanoarchaeia archaeon]
MPSKDEKISTGSFDLNNWLFGGYEKDVITMIAGPPGSGKTNFVILASCSQAKKGNKVVFVDTEGGFSVERVKQIAGENYEEILKNIFLLNPTNFEEQKKDFSKLLDKVKKQHADLIVIDSMITLYRLEIGGLKDEEKIRDLNWKMAGQMRALAEIARKQKIPVILTNQVYHDFLSEEDFRKGIKRETNIVGGDLLKYWSKCIIELKSEDRKRKAILLKHRSLPFKELSFEIKDKGIFKKGWI